MKASIYLYSVISIFLFSGLLSAEFFIANVPSYAKNFTNITITGYVYNSSNTTQGLSGYGVTVTINGTSNVSSPLSGLDGNFTVMIEVPNTAYETNVTVNTTSMTKNYMIRLSPASVSRMYLQGVANISTGSTFTINASVTGGSAGGNLSVILPNITIFDIEGTPATGWVVVNITPNQGGHVLFNISASNTSSGTYIIVVGRGAGVFPVYIRSSTVVSVITQTPTNNTKLDFYPGDSAVIVAKFRDSNSNPISGLSPMAYVTLPNGTIISLSMNATAAGIYKATFGTTSAAGTYSYSIAASVSGVAVNMDSSFGVRYFDAMLSEDVDRFVSWSGTTAVLNGSNVSFLLPVLNLTSGSIVTGSASGAAGSVDCRGIRLEDVSALGNSTSINASVSPTFNATSTGLYMSNTVCKVNFNAPVVSGTYIIKVSVTHGGQRLEVEKSFIVQGYFMKVAPVSSFGWSFKQSFSPNTNASFKLVAYNASTNTELAGTEVTAISVTDLFDPMLGRELSTPLSYAPTNGLGLLNVTIPNQTGPMVLSVEATVSGSRVRSSAFFFSNYVTGYAFPSQSGGGPGGEGSGEQFSGIRCSGNATFMAMVKDAATGEAVQGATLSAVRALRSELTGQDLTSCVTNVTQGTTSSTGTGTMVVFFNSSCSLSGFHFMLMNISYRGNQDALPAGFRCSNMNFRPTIYNDQGQFAWRLSPRSNITINITNPTILSNDSTVWSGNMSVVQIFTFDPATGEQRYVPNAVVYANITNGNGSLVVYPSQFGSPALSTWPTGFMMMEVQVCNKDRGACSTSETGMQVTAFDVWVSGAFAGPPSQYITGQNVSLNLQVRANVTRGGNVTGQAGFQVLVGKPWEGEMVTATNYVNASRALLVDGWNSSTDWGFEQWEVNFTLPTAITNGETIAMIKVTGNNSGLTETAQTETFFTVQKFNVFVPSEEFVEFREGWYNIQEQWGNQSLQQTGWNMINVSNITRDITGSNVLSKSGWVCAKPSFNVTRYGNFGQSTLYTYNTTGFVMVLDRNTAGVYDTAIFYNLSGQNEARFVNLTMANKLIQAVPSGGLYLWNIEGCWGMRIFNSNQSTSASGWIGTHEYRRNITIPYIVRKSATQPMANTTVGIDNIIKQSLTGFGMEAVINSTDYSVVNALTDVRGVGFLTLNITQTGRMMVFWKANDSTETDRASFASGSSLESRAFQVESTSGNFDENSSITLYKRQHWGWLNSSNTYEGYRSNFIYLPGTYMSVDFDSNLTRVDDDNNATGDYWSISQNPVTSVNFTGATTVTTGGPPGPSGDAYVLYWKNTTAVDSAALFKAGGLDQFNLSVLVSDPIAVGTGIPGGATRLVTVGQNLTGGDYWNLSIERLDSSAGTPVGSFPFSTNISLRWDTTMNSSLGTCNETAGASSAKLLKIASNYSAPESFAFNVSVLNATNFSTTVFANTLYYDLLLNRTYVALYNASNNNMPLGCFVVVRNDTVNHSKIYYMIQQASSRFADTNPPQEQISFINYTDRSTEVRITEYLGNSTNYLAYLKLWINSTQNFTELNYTNQAGTTIAFNTVANITERGSKLSMIETGNAVVGRVHLNMTRRILGKTLRFYPQTVREALDLSGGTNGNKFQLLANEYTEAGNSEATCEGSLYQCRLNGTGTIHLNNGGSGREVKAISITRNSTEATVAFAEQNWGGMGMITVNTSYDNVTLMVCPKDFQKPNGRPVYDAVIMNATTMTWQMMGPPTSTALRMYSPLTGSAVTNMSVGPSGCALVRIGHPSGWSAEFGSSEIQLTIQRLSDGANETTWGGMVFLRREGGPGGPGGGQG